MKLTYLLVIISLVISTNSHSQPVEESISIDLPCYNTQEIFKSLREKYKEFPVMSGKASDEANSVVSIWMNPIDNNWTIVATKNNLSCVVGMGTDIKILNYKLGVGI